MHENIPDRRRNLVIRRNPPQDVRTYKGGLYVVDELAEAPPQPLPGALVAFARNGASQHVAYRCCPRLCLPCGACCTS